MWMSPTSSLGETYVEFSQRIHDGTVAFSGKGGQREDGHPDRKVLGKLCDAAEGAAHWRGLGGINDYGQWHADDNHQEIGQRQGEDVSGIRAARTESTAN